MRRVPEMVGQKQVWTPTLTAATTSPTLGTGSSQIGLHTMVSKLTTAWFKIVFGSAGVAAGSGSYRINVPMPAETASGLNAGRDIVGNCTLYDSSLGGNATHGFMRFIAGSASLQLYVPVGGGGGDTAVSDAAPWVWAANDEIHGVFNYVAL